LSAVGLASKQPKREEKAAFDFPKSWYFNQGQYRQDLRANKALENKLDTNDFSTTLTDLITASKRNPVVILNEETGKKETWNILPLTKSVKDQFTVPVSIVTENRAPYTIQKEVDHVLAGPGNKFIAYTKKLDENGTPIPHKFDQVEIQAKDLALEVLKPYTTVKNRSAAVQSAIDNISNYIYDGKTYTKKQIDEAASQWNMTPDEYIKKHNIQKKIDG
jgi:hypothetical protein